MGEEKIKYAPPSQESGSNLARKDASLPADSQPVEHI